MNQSKFKDRVAIIEFRRIIKNYLKMKRIENEYRKAQS